MPPFYVVMKAPGKGAFIILSRIASLLTPLLILVMSSEPVPVPVPISQEELLLRQKKMRRVVLIRGFLIGAMVSAWWILFLPASMMDSELKNILGFIAGLLATASYLYNLRQTILPPQS